MNRFIYRVYDRLFLYLWNIGTSSPKSIWWLKKLANSWLFILWLKQATKYSITTQLYTLYGDIKYYDLKDTRYFLQFPRSIFEECEYSYLIHRIFVGYHPNIKRIKITLDEVLALNPIKSDKQWTGFLSDYLSYYWANSNKRVTRNKLNSFVLKNSLS